MDVSRFMTDLIEINEDEHWADVEPGVIRDSLNSKAAHYDLCSDQIQQHRIVV